MSVKSLTRRLLLQILSRSTLFGLFVGSSQKAGKASRDAETSKTDSEVEQVSHWHKTHDRVWLGEQFWANPMEDWRVSDGAAECLNGGGKRSIHLLTHQLTNTRGTFEMLVKIQQVAEDANKAGAGFKIGIRSDLNEYRSNCFAKSGIQAGLIGNKLTLGKRTLVLDSTPKEFELKLSGKPVDNQYELILQVMDSDKQEIGAVRLQLISEKILGNVAVVSNFESQKAKRNIPQYRFSNWRVGGNAFTKTDSNRFGPILWSMYTLSDTRTDEGFVLKMSALTGPLDNNDNQSVELHVENEKEGNWESLGTAQLDTDAWVATFRIPNWDATITTSYRLTYVERHRDGSETEANWTGTIQANPVGRPLRFGALTCQNDYGFPYAPVAENLIKLAPDMLYFSGDQIYEGHGGFGIVREPAPDAILSYLRKYYMFGWAFGQAMKDRPTIVLPDDHDVFQGNIWGEGGKPMTKKKGGTSSNGGYREPARMVNAVHKTCVAHHPDPYDPNPSLQDISVYFGDLVYGDVSFAVVADRQWKSGPKNVKVDGPRADHVVSAEFDSSKLDVPGLVLLGQRQEEFLKVWAADWKSHSMKVLLSQTVFANIATHHGKYDGYLKADLDSGGWPQTARNRAIDTVRSSMALHICGDQHLATLSQYGVHQQRDSNWCYCTPAISAGYPRWWRPDEVDMDHNNRPEHGLDNTGEYIDGFGNKVYVYAVGNPEVGKLKHRYERAHQKGSGFGLVTIDSKTKTYTIDAFRFSVDATDGKLENQFPGWPVTIHQAENRGENRLN